MKKFIILIFSVINMITFIPSCKKIDQPVEYATVTFDYRMVETNSMVTTRTVNNEIINNINSLLPPAFIFTLTSLKDYSTYQCEIGKSIQLPIGEYAVRYTNILDQDKLFVVGTSQYVTRTPTITISEHITINKDFSAYTLNAEFVCFAIVYDLNEVESISMKYRDWQYINDRYIYINRMADNFEMGIFFYTGISDTSIGLKLNVFSNDTRLTTTDYNLTSNRTGVCVENGKYYIFHPDVVSKVSPSFSVSYPDWVEGEI